MTGKGGVRIDVRPPYEDGGLAFPECITLPSFCYEEGICRLSLHSGELLFYVFT